MSEKKKNKIWSINKDESPLYLLEVKEIRERINKMKKFGRRLMKRKANNGK